LEGIEMSDSTELAMIATSSGAVATIEESRAIAETKAAIYLARQFPRDESRVIEQIVSDCGELSVASTATYTYARGGTNISGPSIRLAELIARRWGNIECGVRELERTPGKSIAQAFAWDMQTNFKDSKTFEVPHVRELRGGNRRILTDPRDLYEIVANDGARRKRACILAMIPAHVVDAAVEQCKATMIARDPVTPEKLNKMIAAFQSEFGVSRGQIEKRFQRKIEAITPAQFVMLRGIFQALRDGVAIASDHFEPETIEEKPEHGVAGAKNKLAVQLERSAPLPGAGMENAPDRTDQSMFEPYAPAGSKQHKALMARFSTRMGRLAEMYNDESLNQDDLRQVFARDVLGPGFMSSQSWGEEQYRLIMNRLELIPGDEPKPLFP
jgi:hypothetical protein